MRLLLRYLSPALLAAVSVSPVVITGCAEHASYYRVHDPYYDDDHLWRDNEVVFYTRWEGETHREHRDIRRRSEEERREYFKWRHDHEHDRDRH